MTRKPNELIFISRINRDGSGVMLISESHNILLQQTKYLETMFEMHSLSVTEDTWIACGFNSYVVKLKETKTDF